MLKALRQMLLGSSLSMSIILPAIFLNPVLFLHSLNFILALMLPPVAAQCTGPPPPPYTPTGPSAEHPHLNIHESDGLCWSYTITMVAIQLVVFARLAMQQSVATEETQEEVDIDVRPGRRALQRGRRKVLKPSSALKRGALRWANAHASPNHLCTANREPSSSGDEPVERRV